MCQKNKARVVHCKKEPYDIYVGRPSKWGNPFSHKGGTLAKFKVATREEAVQKFREWIVTQPDLMAALPELKGKTLACWCSPLACHGDVLLELANGPGPREIFVFGSNLAGRHGRGSAYEAKKNWGARNGVGVGPAGNSYAIPTKDEKLRVLPLSAIREYIKDFLAYADANPNMIFRVVRIGCGLAGFREEDMAPLFQGAPANCQLPTGWREMS